MAWCRCFLLQVHEAMKDKKNYRRDIVLVLLVKLILLALLWSAFFRERPAVVPTKAATHWLQHEEVAP